jgi:uncharacterized membrane protein
MKQQRLDGLADGIFAIVMTLLAIELHVPSYRITPADSELVSALVKIWPVFISLVLSFALLFTYWRAHHFIASVYAKNLSVGLANINAIFFFLITLVPFSAHMLGTYPESRVSIVLYGLNVIAIGFSLYFMRRHIEDNPEIETTIITKADRRSGYIRILFPVFSAAIALLASYWNTQFSIVLFTVAIVFNLLPASRNTVHRWLDLVFKDDDELVETVFTGQKDLLKDEEYICVPKAVIYDHRRFAEYDKKFSETSAKKTRVSKRAKKEEARMEKEIEETLKHDGAEEIIKKNRIKVEE